MALFNSKKKNQKKNTENSDIDVISSDLEEVNFDKDRNGVLSIDGKEYAVEIFWNNVNDINNATSEAKVAAKSSSFSADFYCVRGENTPQYGLGFKAYGHKPGMPSLASHLNEMVTGNWIGVFKVSGSYYLVAVRDDAVLTDYDKVFTDEEEIREEFSDIFYSSTWEHAYAPKDWGVDDTEEKNIEDLLNGTPEVKLKDVSSVRVLIKYGGVIAILAGLFFGGLQLYKTFFEEEVAETVTAVYKEVETRIIEQTGVKQVEQEVIPDAPWLNKPVGLSFMSSCVTDIKKMDINVPGWEAKGMICSDGVTSMLLNRSGGTINWISYYYNGKGSIDPNIIPLTDDSVEIGYPSAVVSRYPASIETFPINQVRRYLFSQFDEVFLKIKFTSIDEFPHPEAYRFFDGIGFEFTTNHEPTDFTKILSRIPVLLIDRVEYNIVNDTWTVSGQSLHRKTTPLPPQQN
mgnify:CR=1 FL=1